LEYAIPAGLLGMLSAPLNDRFPGQSTFKGVITHTGLWPKGGVDLKGKRVAVVAPGYRHQVIQTIAPEVGSMKVFVRTPQYIVPIKIRSTRKRTGITGAGGFKSSRPACAPPSRPSTMTSRIVPGPN